MCTDRRLARTMCGYLIRRIEDNPAIVLTATELVALEGTGPFRAACAQSN